MNSSRQNLRQLIFALTAMVVGMALAWSQLALRESTALPATSIAKVGDTLVSKADFQRALAATESARRNSLAPEQREAVLNKLINEQLLLQYGEHLGLVRSDPVVRKPLVQSVLGLVRANVLPPNDEDAQRWYAENAAQFLPPALYRVTGYQFRSAVLAGKTATLLQAGDVLPAELEAGRIRYLPNTLLPPAKLKDYIGRDGWRWVDEQPSGAVLGPEMLFGKLTVLQLLERREAKPPAFADIREQVVNALTRERGEQALTELVARLRHDYGVTVNRELLSE